MNYLGHYFYNHAVCQIEPQPYFVVGVALPDLWPRFSRKRRIHWNAVREAAASDPQTRQLRDGLLNHAAVDQRFHALPAFLCWQRELKARVVDYPGRPVLLDFMAHVALELVLDHRVVCAHPQIGERIYDRIASCDARAVEQRVSVLGKVDARGLAAEIASFVSRRFLPRFARRETLPQIIDFVLSLTDPEGTPPQSTIHELLEIAHEMVEPETVWAEMGADEPIPASPAGHGTVGLPARSPAV
jgi:hypothetical protein